MWRALAPPSCRTRSSRRWLGRPGRVVPRTRASARRHPGKRTPSKAGAYFPDRWTSWPTHPSTRRISRAQRCCSKGGVVGAGGVEPPAPSVSETWGGSRRPATSASAWPASWADDRRAMTVVVRYGPVVRGPDVAPLWPQRSRAWKARPVPASRPKLRRCRSSEPPGIDRC
jgi:hypothetical protein